jgi:hypothetical protein
VRRRPARPPDLTSLVDVLFILVFAALIQVAAGASADDEPAPAPEPAAAAPPDAGVPAPPPALAALRARALAELTRSLEDRAALVARVDGEGRLALLELADRQLALGAALLDPVPDPDVVVAYAGEHVPARRVCALIARRLGERDLARYLIVVTAEVPLADLPVALVAGLRADAERCALDQRGLAVVIDPAALPGATPAGFGLP